MKGRISKRTVDALACQNDKTKEVLWDDALSGFGVKALPTGAKTYIVQYRQHGRSRTLRLGDHGRLTPDEARSLAKQALGAVEHGADPIEERRQERAVRTFAGVAGDWLQLHVEAKRKGRTARGYADLLRLHVLPALGSLRITDVRRVDVARLHSKMRKTPGAANRTLAVVSAIWNWAARRDEVAAHENPAKGIEKYREQGKERFLTTEELARLGEALTEAEAIGLLWNADEDGPNAKHLAKPDNRRTKVDPFALAAIRLLILTGCRLSEIIELRWSHVDFERGMVFLPDSKTGKKPVYLSAAALRIFADLPRIDGNPHVIAGANDGEPRADLKRPWEALRRTAGLEGVRIHDLRHSFASVGAGASLGLPIVGKLLGHKQAATTQRYAHLDADPLRRAAETIGATISAKMEGGRGAAAVVELAGRKNAHGSKAN
jgi:integrase